MAAPTPTLFVTGISGFVGRALLERLAPRRVPDGKGERPGRLLGLSRNVTAVAQRNVELVQGDLRDPSAWGGHLEGVDAVLHLAALTGKARAADYERVNVEGTRAVIEAARAAGVRRFFHVSSIAATYSDLDRYPYGGSKARAEELVRGSGLEWSILRPTIVLGKRARLWHSLAALAKLPVMPVFGTGEARVQPIGLENLVDAIAEWLAMPDAVNTEVDLGGPDVLSMEELLRRMRSALRGSRGPAVHVPARPLAAALGVLEGPLFGVLPFTAGQLHAFTHDGIAAPNALTERLARPPYDGLQTVDEMIAELARG